MVDFDLGNMIRAAENSGKTLARNATLTAGAGMVRRVLNAAIGNVTPARLLQAIQKNQSLWREAGGDIGKIAACLPPSVIQTCMPMYRNALAEYGNTTNLVLAWLNQDNPALHSVIIKTEGGIDWFDRQVREICEKIGLDYECT